MGFPKGVSTFCGRYAKLRERDCGYAANLRKLNIVH